jgi:hypothetical protein
MRQSNESPDRPLWKIRLKRVLSLVLAAAIPGFLTPDLLPAQPQRVGFLFNLGFMAKGRIAADWLTLGPELMIPLGKALSLNPEVTFWISNFGPGSYSVAPGALANFRAGHLSVGAGAVWRFGFSGYPNGDSAERISLKIQVGYGSRNSRIALIVIPLPTDNGVSFGLAIGIGF